MNSHEFPENIFDLKKDKKKKLKKRSSEESEQFGVISYLKLKYPNVIFRCSPEGIRMSIGMAVKLKKNGILVRGLPDIEIFEPHGKYAGLFIELKKTGRKLKKKDGSWIDEHTQEQFEILEKLKTKGYYATFAIGLQDAIKIIDNYFGEQNF